MNRRLLHYEIIREIGRGGMGVVYQANDTRLDRPVAIKVLPADKILDPERKQRFVLEARAASALNHPNIVTVHDINADAGTHFIVMEYAAGKTLDQIIGSKGIRSPLALKYSIQLADALAKAHAAGILHRDLKPANLMVCDEPNIMNAKKQSDIAGRATDSSPVSELMETNPVFTRREMLGITGMAGLAALTGSVSGAVAQTAQKRPRIACLVTYWGATRSHADWIVTKLLDGYWWQGAHTPSRVEVVSVYIHQLETSGLGQKICKSKGIPIFNTVGEAVTLGAKELAVDGVVIVGEHGEYPTNLKGQWLLPRWWIYQQVIRVFEQSKRSVPVFNDKHLSYSWDEAKWMFDKSRELNFPLTGGSSIPIYFRKPEIELDIDTPIRASVVVGGAADEGALFHCVDVLQAFAERRKGGETGVKAVQCIRGPETWKWTERNPWAGKLLEAVRTSFDLKPGHFQEIGAPNVCIAEYRDGTKAAVYSGRGVGWTYAGEIEGQKDPTIVSMLGWPGPFSQYHASNAQPHWITEMMVTGKEPFNAERLLLSTGIVSYNMESNWENGRYSAIGRRIETPFMNMTYRSTRGPQFNKGERPPNIPYIRGFDT